jgi:hypothetical protein
MAKLDKTFHIAVYMHTLLKIIKIIIIRLFFLLSMIKIIQISYDLFGSMIKINYLCGSIKTIEHLQQ